MKYSFLEEYSSALKGTDGGFIKKKKGEIERMIPKKGWRIDKTNLFHNMCHKPQEDESALHPKMRMTTVSLDRDLSSFATDSFVQRVRENRADMRPKVEKQ